MPSTPDQQRPGNRTRSSANRRRSRRTATSPTGSPATASTAGNGGASPAASFPAAPFNPFAAATNRPAATGSPHRATPPASPVPVSAGPSSFTDLGVPGPIVAALVRRGATSPFPIQSATLPDSLAGRDVLGRGRTGSGKTIAFAVPVVARLAASSRPRRTGKPRALILLPTRELASQVADTVTPLASAAGLVTTVVFGGVKQTPQVNALRRGVDVLIACPGRLEDLIRQGHVQLDAVEVTVLDEADHMADLGFLPGVRRLLDATPGDGQRLLFSATLDNGIDVIVRRYLNNPVVHAVDPVDAAPTQMTHHLLFVEPDQKTAVIRELARGRTRTVLFTRTKHGARKLARQLTAAGIPAVDLHGNLSQNARQRNLAAFTSGGVRVLVATDIAARGIHVDDVALVVHVDPPDGSDGHKAYTHRSGRTARAGAAGVVVTVATPDQAKEVTMLTRKAGVRPRRTDVAAGHPLLLELTGPQAALVAPTPPSPDTGARPARQPGKGARRR